MSRPDRWPLHPRPQPGEALSSWLERIAAVYGLTLDALAKHHLGVRGVAAGGANLSTGHDLLDVDPPVEVLRTLHERTGIAISHLRTMTVAGWVPWLLDTLEVSQDEEAFATFVREDCSGVLLRPGEIEAADQGYDVSRWRAWLPGHSVRIRQGCPQCSPRVFLLMAQLPVMLSCPRHGCRLVEASQLRLADALGRDIEQPVAASEPVAAMDRRTHEGVTTGRVTLPFGQIHVGVWFRLLRGVLDEVNAQISRLRRSAAKDALRRVWQGTGLRYRAGQQQWRPFEAMDGRAQDAMLEAAAAAMHLVETGELPGRGPMAHVFQVQQYVPVPAGDPPVSPRSAGPWARVQSDIRAMIDEARNDPVAALRTMRMFAALCGADLYGRIRDDLVLAGVPDHFLPGYEQARRQPQTCGPGVQAWSAGHVIVSKLVELVSQ